MYEQYDALQLLPVHFGFMFLLRSFAECYSSCSETAPCVGFTFTPSQQCIMCMNDSTTTGFLISDQPTRNRFIIWTHHLETLHTGVQLILTYSYDVYSYKLGDCLIRYFRLWAFRSRSILKVSDASVEK